MISASDSPSPSVFVRVARWCAAHRGLTVLGWIAVLAVAWTLGSTFGTQKISSYRLPGTESQKAYDVLSDHAPTRNGVVDQFVFVARKGTLREGPARAGMQTALQRLSKDPVVVGVSDPLRGGQLTRDGRIGIAMVTYKSGAEDYDVKKFERVEKAGFSARGPDLRIEHGGQGAEAVRQAANQGSSTELLGLLAAAIVLMITFGSAIAAGVPLLSALLALGAALGLVPVISHVVDTPDFASKLAALIGLGVGIDYALMVVTRYRAEHARGLDRDEALLAAIDTAGRTVFFAGLTVIIALLGLLLLGLAVLQGAAVASALAVALVMSASLTLLPALLSKTGDWIDRLRLPLPRRRRTEIVANPELPGESPAWARWSDLVQRRPIPAIVVALAILLALAVPALHMRLGSSDAGLDPPGTTTRAAYDLIADGFGAGTNGQFLLTVELPRRGDAAAAKSVAQAVARDPNVAVVTPAQLSPDGQVATITLYAKTGPQDVATTDLLDRLRDDRIPAVERDTGVRVFVGGVTASQEDFTQVIAQKLPLFVGIVVLLSALLLMAVFRSVFVPLKAAVMNLLSIGAALGFVTLVFQDGHLLAGALSVGTGPVESFVPVMMFAIVFGLSMDYEMFLMSRAHEEWLKTGDASRAMRNGLATTGRVITAAAAIMIVVFSSFALGPDRIIKEFGLGLAMAVLLDAVVIRCLLVPAIMELAGARAWWLPSWLERRIPRLALERG
jgi:RND superfamily putative drug exporter